MTASAGASTPSPEALADDRPCLQCGYNLRGLDPGAVCPECGTPIARSLQGNLLKFSGAPYLEALHRGVFLIQTGVIIQFLAMVGSILANMVFRATATGGGLPANPPTISLSSSTLALQLVGTCASIVGLIGWWLLSAPDPAELGRETGANARKVVRATVIIHAASLALNSGLLLGGAPVINFRSATFPPVVLLMIAVNLASLVAWVVWFFAAMRYLQWLAPRIPNLKVLTRSKRLMWLGPLLYTVGIIVCGLGPLAALILYYNLLEWVRKDLRAFRAVQAAGV